VVILECQGWVGEGESGFLVAGKRNSLKSIWLQTRKRETLSSGRPGTSVHQLSRSGTNSSSGSIGRRWRRRWGDGRERTLFFRASNEVYTGANFIPGIPPYEITPFPRLDQEISRGLSRRQSITGGILSAGQFILLSRSALFQKGTDIA